MIPKENHRNVKTVIMTCKYDERDLLQVLIY